MAPLLILMASFCLSSVLARPNPAPAARTSATAVIPDEDPAAYASESAAYVSELSHFFHTAVPTAKAAVSSELAAESSYYALITASNYSDSFADATAAYASQTAAYASELSHFFQTAAPSAKAAASSELAAESSYYAQITASNYSDSFADATAAYASQTAAYASQLSHFFQTAVPSAKAAVSSELAAESSWYDIYTSEMYNTASIGTSEAAAESSAYAAWTSQLAVYKTYSGTSDLFAFATATAAPSSTSKPYSVTAALAAPTQTADWPLLSLVQQPEPYGVQCKNLFPDATKPVYDVVACSSSIDEICASLDGANKEGTSSSNTDKWVFAYGTSKSCVASFWLPKSAAGTGRVPTVQECQANVYGRMLSLCYINGNVNGKYDTARVNLVHGLMNDTSGTYVQGKSYDGEQVDAGKPSYQLAFIG
ncbi:MAG: hypothetical protein Q9195_006769 [Heterodermia aff. obscurata]